MNDLFYIVAQIVVLLFAISIHESAHGWVANRCGDPTARILGRVTLNPIAHFDLFGSFIVPGVFILMRVITKTPVPVFGWAKPVPINPYNFHNRRRDGLLVSAAGPISNLLITVMSILLFLVIKNFTTQAIVPILSILFFLIIININLAIFNLLPIPPLDGSGILEGILKGNALNMYEKIRPFGIYILLLLIYLNIFGYILFPIYQLIQNILGVGL